MKFLTRTSTKEKFLLSFTFLVFVASTISLLYFDRIFFKPVVDEADRIGSIEMRRGSVDRRTPEMFEFIAIFQNDVIGNGDSIFTGNASIARVRLQEDSLIYVAADSLVVFREKDGKFNIKIEKGEVSGEISKDTEIEFQTEEEAIILNGNEFTSFTLSYDQNKGIEIKEISSQDSQSKSQPTLKNEKQAPIQTRRNHKTTNSQFDSSETGFKNSEQIPDSSKELIKQKEKPVRIQSSVKTPDMITNKSYSAPYPKLNQVLLIKNATKVVLLPKSKCLEQCLVTVLMNEKTVTRRKFPPDRVPILTIPVGEDFKGNVQWMLQEDGQKLITGSFKIKPFTMDEFGKALKAKKNIEVID